MTGAAAHEVLVPREIVNADTVCIVSWAVADGAAVDAGAPLCEIETSKAIVTVDAEVAGFVHRRAAVGDDVAVGGLLAVITDSAAAPATTPAPRPTSAPAPAGAGEVRFSAKAREKVEALGLDISLFAGRGLVRERDIDAIVAEAAKHAEEPATPRPDPRGPYRIETLGPVQRRVAKVMEESVAAIPAASLDRCIDIGTVRERAKALAAESGVVVTEVDLLVAAIATACREFPHFNCFVTGDDRLHIFEQVNVGVAVDVKGDLFVIVLREADAKDPATIAKELRGLQYVAARGRLKPEHLSGGTITITSMIGRGVHRFVPIPYPQQAAIVGIADPQPGSMQSVLTLVFDHRVANGSQAAGFLAAIDAALRGESPAT